MVLLTVSVNSKSSAALFQLSSWLPVTRHTLLHHAKMYVENLTVSNLYKNPSAPFGNGPFKLSSLGLSINIPYPTRKQKVEKSCA